MLCGLTRSCVQPLSNGMDAYVFFVADNTLRGIFFVHEKLTVSSVFGNGSQNFQYSIQDVLQQQKDDGYDW